MTHLGIYFNTEWVKHYLIPEINHAMFKDTHNKKLISEIVQVNAIYPQTGQNIMRGIMRM